MSQAFHPRPLALAAALILATTVGALRPARAQPDPSFRVTCSDLRASVRTLGEDEEKLVAIQVVGPLTRVHSDGTLAYLFMCTPPDPQVLCVTYATNGRVAGDVVVLSGAYSARGPDHILLDPCLHALPDRADPR